MNIVFHVGLHKTATTWLQSVYFNQHPEIQLLNDFKTPWDDELIRSLVSHDEKSFSPGIFRKKVEERIITLCAENHDGVYLISAERLSGHPYSGGFDREQIARNIYQAYPNAKVLVLIRNQISIIESTYQQLVKEGYSATLTQMLNEDCWKRPCFKKAYFDYQQLIEHYTKIFGSDSFHYFLYENMFENKQYLLDNMCGFFNISVRVSKNEGKINSAKPYNQIKAMRIINKFRKSEYNCYPPFDIGSGNAYKIFVKSLSVFYSKDPVKLTQQERKNIMNFYTQSNENILENTVDASLLKEYFLRRL